MTYVPKRRKQRRKLRSKYLYVLKELDDHKHELMHKDGSIIITPNDGEDIHNVRRAVRAFLCNHYAVPKGYKLSTSIDKDGVIWVSLEKV